MGSFTDFLEDKILNHVFRNTAYTAPSTVYVGLCTTTPTDSAGGTEVSTNNYSRVAATFGSPSPSGTIQNSGTVSFPAPSGSWGTVTHFELWDASTSGNRLAWGALTSSQAIGLNNAPSFAIGALVITQD